MKKPRILTNLTIQTLGYGGVGISKAEDGRTILIKGGLPGSVVDVTIIKQKKEYIEAHIYQVHSVPLALVTGELKCPHYLYEYNQQPSGLAQHKTGCGGCKWQILEYTQQLTLKQNIIKDCFHQVKELIPDFEVLAVLPSPKIFGYRNKIEFSFGKYIQQEKLDESGNIRTPFLQEHWLAGFHKQGAFEKVVDIDQCYLISEKAHAVYAYIKQLLKASGLPVYDIKRHTGFFRHLVIREGVHTNEIMVNLVVAHKYFDILEPHRKLWQQVIENMQQDTFLQSAVTTFLLTNNDGIADVVKTQHATITTLRGSGIYTEELHFVSPQDNPITTNRQISPFSFFQTNTLGAEVLFQKAIDMVGPVKGNIIDLYCGSGTIGISFLACGIGQQVKGIEIVADAVRDAYINVSKNHLEGRADFYAGKAEDLLKQGVIDTNFFVGNDLVILDPPREGLHPSVLGFLGSLPIQTPYRICYISCNPQTLARDMITLIQQGWYTKEVQPVDMFPHTHHIESIVILEKKS